MKKLKLIALAAALAAALSGCGANTPAQTPSPTPDATEPPAEIYAYDGYAAREEYPLDEASLENAVSRFKNVYDTYLSGTGSRVFLSVIPATPKNSLIKTSSFPSIFWMRHTVRL